ncbi:RloB domain-containing protein [Muribaculum caecicola]|uniref:RloB domain-containing protein n=1 Tax=Muribaculum caecicola TaxID=3038144 RepID=A0AC61S527_9BACT|nr:RloB family protein [Muribaculum caecicola]THG49462.1 RloB domain-containing protein [Muribaculum caecicola]
MARRIKERKLKNPTITIIGEGATERYYFTHLKRLRGYNYVCKPRNFTEQTFDEMQKQIERVLADNGIAVCVFDADVTRTRPAEKAKFEDMKRKYADNPAVILCDSMPSIEFWFLLHYLNTNRYFATSDDVIDVLHRYMPNFSKHQSFLSKEAWVSELLNDDKMRQAAIRAEEFREGESYTNLHILFNELDSRKS